MHDLATGLLGDHGGVDQLNRCWWGMMDGLSMHHDEIGRCACHALATRAHCFEFDPGLGHMEAVTGSS